MIGNKRIEEALRRAFRYLNRLMMLLWRLGLGNWLNCWPSVLGRFLVIVHSGRKSGLRRHTPVNYAVVGNELYCTAGFGSVSDWYRNIMANPKVEVWLTEGWWAGVAEDVTGQTGWLGTLRAVLIGSGFAARMAGINPRSISDEALAAKVADYRLIHIRRTEARTGAGGPSDLAWVWPFVAVAALGLALRRRR